MSPITSSSCHPGRRGGRAIAAARDRIARCLRTRSEELRRVSQRHGQIRRCGSCDIADSEDIRRRSRDLGEGRRKAQARADAAPRPAAAGSPKPLPQSRAGWSPSSRGRIARSSRSPGASPPTGSIAPNTTTRSAIFSASTFVPRTIFRRTPRPTVSTTSATR